MSDSRKPALDASPLSAAIHRIFETEFPARPREPSLHDYYGDLRKPPRLQKYVRYHDDMLKFARFDPNRKAVLEVGSGFGVVLVWLASLGAYADGLEIVSWQVDDVRAYLARLSAEIRERITIGQGNASQMPYVDSAFDLVLAIEALSHYLDYKQFLAEAHRVLRPGGKLLIVDGCNGLNPTTRRHCKYIWKLHERDIVDDEDPWLFVPKRQQIIEETFPELDASEAHTLALRTSGMVRGQVINAVRAYVETGELPDNVYRPGQVSVHPQMEMVMERLFNPFALAREIRSYGFFEARVQGYWGGASGQPILRAANRALAAMSPVTMLTARSFRIVAVKR
jgi:ubiquinone/menaquinone biosynthesis C-methylase UbiE